MSNWPYKHCPHQHFNKSLAERLHCIPYTIFPDPTIDAFTNLNVKSANLSKSNIPTVAYERYFHRKDGDEQGQLDTNFVKDYYMQSVQGRKMELDNDIVNELKADMATRNAYVLAGSATKQYEEFETRRQNALISARSRAQSAIRLYYQNKKEEKMERDQENANWLRKLCRKLEEIARHIIEGEGGNDAETEKMFLLSKSNLTAKYLSQIKIRDPKSVIDILEELRILMMKKKLKFSDAREQQDKNKSASMSYTSQASQNTSQGSMLSQATSMNDSNIDGQSEIVKKYCDFDQLMKKWRLEDVEDVKILLRIALTRQYVSNAELQAVKKRRQAAKINAEIKLNNLQSKGGANKISKIQSAKTLGKAQSSKKIPNKTNLTVERQIVYEKQNNPLTKDETKIKQKLLQGSQFDATGDKFARNRNYSNILANRAESILFQLADKKNIQLKITANARDQLKTARDQVKITKNQVKTTRDEVKTARESCCHHPGQTLDNSRI